jgi:hypothetical protein
MTSALQPAALQDWHRFVEGPSAERLRALLDADVVFESPVLHTPQVGREITMRYLLGALQVLGNDHFRYVGQWTNADGAILEFVTEVDGVTVNGVDIMRFTADAERIAHFKVMIRPTKAIDVVRTRMAALLNAHDP